VALIDRVDQLLGVTLDLAGDPATRVKSFKAVLRATGVGKRMQELSKDPNASPQVLLPPTRRLTPLRSAHAPAAPATSGRLS
jgi:hypothetical protein